MESEDKVPLVELTFPCGLKGKVYSDQSGMGGMYEVCSRQCPNPEVGGDVNRCEPFKKYDKAIYSERAKVLRKEIHLSERKKICECNPRNRICTRNYKKTRTVS